MTEVPVPPSPDRSTGPRGSLRTIIDSFADIRALVVGEAILDSYLSGPGRGLSREAPVPIVDVSDRTDAPGGAANTAANVRAVGARVTFLSVIGDDPDAMRLKRELQARGIPTDDLVVETGRRTLAKHRLVASGQMIARFDQGTTDPLSSATEVSFAKRLADLWSRADVVIVSDYRYGVMSPGVRRALAELREGDDRPLVVDARELRSYASTRPTAVKPNYEEAVALLELPAVEGTRARIEQIHGCGDRLVDLTGARIAAVTLGADGAVVFERGRAPYRTFTRPTQNSRATGAGDTFVGVLGLSLASGAETEEAADLASAASAVVVGKEVTSVCTAPELKRYVAAESKYISGAIGLRQLAQSLHQERKRIVFTNGCFDILHRGHIAHLAQAKTLGDVLVVGLNTDDSVRRLKGHGRPINTLEDRVEILSALDSVDHIVPFNSDTPIDLIAALRPHLYVKGGDYSKESLPETPMVERLAGEVVILPLISDSSTSGIVERIRAGSGAKQRRR
ncbi:MAG TPA: D-glycero-beta-D-manno-heptose 1-phosphate adenylyltransferase [Actinomycetota bacterium]|nr:D-glycero-beta-D-manno-heptose 1-phosphate adenylyltransferase [Actinomycetota bacterium]